MTMDRVSGVFPILGSGEEGAGGAPAYVFKRQRWGLLSCTPSEAREGKGGLAREGHCGECDAVAGFVASVRQ